MANVNIIEKKQEIVNEIKEKISDASSILLFEYRGLSVIEMMELRRKLKESDTDLKVYKNTLANRAFNDNNYDMKDELKGPKAIAFGTDAIAPIKVIYEFAKKHPALVIRAGIIDGKITEIDTLEKLSSVPSRQELLTMLASGLMATVKDFAICLDLYSQNLEK
ncbi:MAG: 50S ribosomal protein L10 [Bacilli bacterium]|nr:50S ribosomal protein L10 [Bacilli bacterium]MDD4733493.1 50S ribosomal protein L10 [Bacilli bacterium]